MNRLLFGDNLKWLRDTKPLRAVRRLTAIFPDASVVELVEALKKFLKTSPMMAYLAMMAPRLVELHRVLKPTGLLFPLRLSCIIRV